MVDRKETPPPPKQPRTEEPMSRGDLLRYVLPAVITILIAVVAGSVTIKSDIAVLSDHVSALEMEARGHVNREVMDLQLQAVRLEMKLIEQKIDSHCTAPPAPKPGGGQEGN